MYLLDANTYIQAKNLHYGMKFCPAYWEWLDQQYELGVLGSITSVYEELAGKGDELSEWVTNRKIQFLPVSLPEVQDKMVEVAQHVVDLPNKTQSNVSQFLSGADPWLVSRAAAKGETIVTHEVLVPLQSKKVKIPNLCRDFGVQYIATYQLLISYLES
ncbi:DUF4411 family protein [Aestuariirhabdus sp. LZHN29]|uniref:DUF4411 family protein n=1 Tax=Aestuariirhabdus sp. LZHN29 TaxID=3417462 RepID=UPI003CF1BEC0